MRKHHTFNLLGVGCLSAAILGVFSIPEHINENLRVTLVYAVTVLAIFGCLMFPLAQFFQDNEDV